MRASTIGSGATISWIPVDTLGTNCGFAEVELRLLATDVDGTRSDTRTINLGYPAC